MDLFFPQLMTWHGQFHQGFSAIWRSFAEAFLPPIFFPKFPVLAGHSVLSARRFSHARVPPADHDVFSTRLPPPSPWKQL